ncbi:MAG: hypothetical protein ACYC5J_11020 [Chloroflexota bacterium]
MVAPLMLIRRHLKAYLLLNGTFYSLVVLGTLFAFAIPEAQAALTRAILEGFNAPPLSLARDAYQSKNVPAAALVTFLVNSVFGSFLTLTVPSLLIPYAGVAIGLYRAAIWGVALAPTSPELARAMVPHSLTLLLEGQGYILAMFGVHILWASVLAGLRKELPGLGAGYLAGLRGYWVLYRLILLVLAVAAIYEALEVIYLVAR